MNIPDLSKTPAAVNGEFDDFSLSPGDFTQQFNSELANGIGGINQDGFQIELIDIESALNEIIANPESYGFDHELLETLLGEYAPQSVFLNSIYPVDPESDYNIGAIGSGDYEDEFARWLFWDHVHPTQAGHEALANYIFNTAVVPEPETYAWALGSLALFGACIRQCRMSRRGDAAAPCSKPAFLSQKEAF